MIVSINVNNAGKPAGKLADAELHFEKHDGILDGLRLIGFAVWQRRGSDSRRVTFPARRYSSNGERRSYFLLRPIAETPIQTPAHDRVRDLILDAYAKCEGEVGRPVTNSSGGD